MAVGDVYRTTAQFQSTAGDIFQWVWHYVQDNGGEIAADVIGAAVTAQLETAWANIESDINTVVSGQTLEVAKYDSGNDQFDTLHTEALPATMDGANAGELMPFQEAVVVKFFTALGRSIGKKYLFGFVADSVNSQNVEATFLTDAVFFALDLQDTVVAGGADFSPGNFNQPTQTFRPWTGTVEVNTLLGTQDRRRRGVGL